VDGHLSKYSSWLVKVEGSYRFLGVLSSYEG